ncbi:hypothetical protein JCM8097_004176 [Rhodosporidiobolus ruineniae]
MAGGATTTSGIRAAGPALTRAQELYAFALIASLFFLWGFSYSLVDVLNKKVQTSFSITKTESTAIQACYFGAYFVCCLPASFFASRFGYRIGILLGLTLFIIGALLFWPAAHYAVYWPFPVCSFVIASGLATLEVMANSYMTVLGSPEYASFRLNIAQAVNGLATVIGPQIASHTFLKDDSKDLTQLQYVYLAVGCLGGLLFVLFCVAKLPEITEESLEDAQEEAGVVDERPLWKRKHTMFGFVVQFCYTGAQVAIASLVINYLTDKGAYSTPRATQLFSYMQICFMLSRFVGVVVIRFIPSSIALSIYGLICMVFCLMASFTSGETGLVALFILFFGESIIYPTVFALATQFSGREAKRAAGLISSGVAGGAVFPPMQAALADARNTELSYIIPALLGYLPCIPYGIGMYFYGRRMAAVVAGQTRNVEVGAQVSHGDSQDDKNAGEVEEIELR